MARSILVAVDIENQTASAKRLLQTICHDDAFLAQRLNVGIDLVYVEDIKTYPEDKYDSPRIRAWHSQHQKRLEEVSRQFPAPLSAR